MPLVDSQNVFLPPLYVKLGLMKIFVRAMDKTLKVFCISELKFDFEKSEAKLKDGLFICSEIRYLMRDD